MSAELLRRAAALMRERAEGVESLEKFDDSVEEWSTEWLVSGGFDYADADHIASWSPPVALAVAELLEAAATFREEVDATGGAGHPIPGEDHALAVARTYLGETA